MRTPIVLLLGFALVVHGDDIALNDGTVYHKAKITFHDAVNATIIDNDGGAVVPIAKLPTIIQKQLGYDQTAADKQAADEEHHKQLVALSKQLSDASVTAQGAVQEVLPDGLLFDSLSKQCIETVEARHGDTTSVNQPIAGQSSDVVRVSSSTVETQSLVCIGLGRGFVACKTDGMIDGQSWSGVVWKVGTYSYTNVTGSRSTIVRYTTDPTEALKALSDGTLQILP